MPVSPRFHDLAPIPAFPQKGKEQDKSSQQTGMAAILSAAAFGAVCGSSVATSGTITQVAYPEMKKHGYHGRLSTAVLATSGTLGILIPPSVPLVVYAILCSPSTRGCAPSSRSRPSRWPGPIAGPRCSVSVRSW